MRRNVKTDILTVISIGFKWRLVSTWGMQLFAVFPGLKMVMDFRKFAILLPNYSTPFIDPIPLLPPFLQPSCSF